MLINDNVYPLGPGYPNYPQYVYPLTTVYLSPPVACEKCGAGVVDTLKHYAWHDENDRADA